MAADNEDLEEAPPVDLEALVLETLEAQRQLGVLQASQPHLPRQPLKKMVLERLLEKGMLQVQVDCTLPGVNVPQEFLGQSNLVLNFSRRFAVGDLNLTEEVLEETLSFHGVNHKVRLPLRAIVAARSAVTGEPAEFQVFTGEGQVEGQEDPPPPTPKGAA